MDTSWRKIFYIGANFRNESQGEKSKCLSSLSSPSSRCTFMEFPSFIFYGIYLRARDIGERMQNFYSEDVVSVERLALLNLIPRNDATTS